MTGPINCAIHKIAIDKNNKKWFAAKGGISSFDTTWNHYNYQTDNIEFGNIIPVNVNSPQKIVIANRYQMARYNFYSFNDKYNLEVMPQLDYIKYNSATMTTALLDKNKTPWIVDSTILYSYINKIKTKVDSAMFPILNNNIQKTLQDNKDNIWLIHANSNSNKVKGFSVFNGTDWTITSPHDTMFGKVYTISKIAKSDNGTIWFATLNGLVKLENNIFTKYDTTNSPLLSNTINDLFTVKNEVTIATSKGIYTINNGQWTAFYNANNGFANLNVLYVTKEFDGAIWAKTNLNLLRLRNNNVDTFSAPNSFSHLPFMNKIMYQNEDSSMFFFQPGSYTIYKNDEWRRFNYPYFTYNDNVQTISLDTANVLYALKYNNGNVCKFKNNYWSKDIDILPYMYKNLYIQKNKTKWLIQTKGIYKVKGKQSTLYEEANSLLNPLIPTGIIEDKNGLVYFYQKNRIVVYKDSTFSIAALLNATFFDNEIVYMAFDNKNRILVATSDKKLFRQNEKKENLFDLIIDNTQIKNITVDRNNTIWASSTDGLIKIYNNSTFIYNSTNSKLTCNDVYEVQVDSLNNKWIGTKNGLYQLIDECHTNTIELQKKYVVINNSPLTEFTLQIKPANLFNYQISWYVNNQLKAIVKNKNTSIFELTSPLDSVHAVITPLEDCYTYDSLKSKYVYSTHTTSNDCIIYPNPTSNEINIVTSTQTINSIKNIRLINTMGNLIIQKEFTGDRTLLYVKQLPKGVYMLQVNCNSNMWNYKIVKN